MRVFKVLTVTLFALVTCIGAVLAADEPLQIGGGGRLGVAVNGKGGAENGFINDGSADGANGMGSMPNYAQSRYWGISLSKKFKSDDGSWVTASTYIDNWNSTVAYDEGAPIQFRFRSAALEFGGVDFLPQGATIWAGLKGVGTGGTGQQDNGLIDFAGIGFGVTNLGGILSISYLKEDNATGTDFSQEETVANLGIRTIHNFVVSAAVPMADIYAALGFSPAAKSSEKSVTDLFIGGIVHPGMGGLNVAAMVGTGAYGYRMFEGGWSDSFLMPGNDGKKGVSTAPDLRGTSTVLSGNGFSGANAANLNDYTDFTAQVYAAAELGSGLYLVPAIKFDMLSAGKQTSMALNSKATTYSRANVSVRLEKSLTKNLALVPTLGYYYGTDSGSGDKAIQIYQETLALQVSLNQGFTANEKIQFYATANECNNVGKTADALGAAYTNKAFSMDFGCLVTWGF